MPNARRAGARDGPGAVPADKPRNNDASDRTLQGAGTLPVGQHGAETFSEDLEDEYRFYRALVKNNIFKMPNVASTVFLLYLIV